MSSDSAASEAAPRPVHPALIVRDADAGLQFERFFITAVATILVIRAFLALTGYPQLAHGRLHVAHMLWGGLALATALLLSLVSLSRRARPVAALIGGAGFGFFIDELGKFLTRDNDYFFQPTISLIYVLFVALFLVVRGRLSSRALDAEENMVNAIWLMQDVALGDLDMDEKARALAYLDRCEVDDPRVIELRRVFDRLEALPQPRPSALARLRNQVGARTEWLLARRAFPLVVTLLLIAQAAAVLGWTVFRAPALWGAAAFGAPGPSPLRWARLAVALASGGFTAAGAVLLFRKRATAYRCYRLALHISLLLTQVFVFYESQLAGLVSLTLNLLLLGAVERLLRREATRLSGPLRP